jgi:hypothetical protein
METAAVTHRIIVERQTNTLIYSSVDYQRLTLLFLFGKGRYALYRFPAGKGTLIGDRWTFSTCSKIEVFSKDVD